MARKSDHDNSCSFPSPRLHGPGRLKLGLILGRGLCAWVGAGYFVFRPWTPASDELLPQFMRRGHALAYGPSFAVRAVGRSIPVIVRVLFSSENEDFVSRPKFAHTATQHPPASSFAVAARARSPYSLNGLSVVRWGHTRIGPDWSVTRISQQN